MFGIFSVGKGKSNEAVLLGEIRLYGRHIYNTSCHVAGYLIQCSGFCSGGDIAVVITGLET